MDQVHWQAPPEVISLPEDEVHIWNTSLRQPPETVQQFYNVCSADEQKRAADFRFEEDRTRFIVGRGVLRMLLSRYTGTPPDQIIFRYGTDGKPALLTPVVSFNTSHSQDLSVYAITRTAEVGVDMEWAHDIEEIDGIARTLFSPSEIDELTAAVSAAEKQSRFFTTWTRKEAYLKAIGTGLTGSLVRVHVSGLPCNAPRVLSLRDSTGQGTTWFLADFEPLPGYSAAVAVRGAAWRLQFYSLPQACNAK